jgi:glycerol-3-phosphate acyltransferase PlsX
MPVTVAVDAMGGDHGPSVTLAASLSFLEQIPDAHVIAVGIEPELRAALAKMRSPAASRLMIHAATEVVEMHETPAWRCRNRSSSMGRGQSGQGRHRASLRIRRQYRRLMASRALS